MNLFSRRGTILSSNNLAARRRWLPALLVAGALAAFYFPLLDGAQVYRRATWRQVVPCRAFLGEELRAGRFPTWFPYEQLGTPFLAQVLCAELHPLSWLSAFLRPERVVSLQVLCGAAIAAAGAWFLASVLGALPFGCAIASVSFALSGYLVLNTGHLYHLWGAAHLPWQLAFFFLAALRGWSRWSLTGTVAATLSSTLMGNLQLGCFFAVIAAAAGFLLSPGSRRLSYVLGTALAGLLTAGLLAPQLIPTLLFLRQTTRTGAGLPWDEVSYWSLHPLRIPELLLPAFAPIGSAGRAEHLFGSDPGLLLWSEALGGSAIVSVLAAGALASPRLPRRVRAVLAALGGAGLVLSLGKFTPLFRFLYDFVPGFRSFRFPEKFVPLCLCALSILAALGWTVAGAKWWRAAAAAGAVAFALTLAAWRWRAADSFISDYALDLGWSLSLAAAALFAIALVARVGGTVAQLGALALVGVEVMLGSSRAFDARPLKDSEGVPQSIPILRKLGVRRGEGRIVPFGFFYSLDESEFFTSRERWWMDLERSAVVGDMGGWLRVESAQDYLSGGDRSFLEAKGGPADRWLTRIAPRLNVVAAVVPDNFRKSNLGLGREVAHLTGGIHILQLPNPWPRAYLAGGVPLGPSTSAYDALERLEPHRVLIAGWSKSEPPKSGAAFIATYQPDHVRVSVDAPEEAFLVLNDLFSPGWIASLDGQSARIWRANGLVRAVRVPAGHHVVVLTYRAPGLRTGLYLFAISLAGLAVVLLFFPQRRFSSGFGHTPI